MNKIAAFFKRYWKDIVIVLGIAVCSIATILIVHNCAPKNANFARIYQQNEVILEIDLSKESDEVRSIEFPNKDIHMVIGVKKNAIAVLSSDCPHQDCVHMGWTSSSSKPIICAHYKVSIEIAGNSINDVEIA